MLYIDIRKRSHNVVASFSYSVNFGPISVTSHSPMVNTMSPSLAVSFIYFTISSKLSIYFALTPFALISSARFSGLVTPSNCSLAAYMWVNMSSSASSNADTNSFHSVRVRE